MVCQHQLRSRRKYSTPDCTVLAGTEQQHSCCPLRQAHTHPAAQKQGRILPPARTRERAIRPSPGDGDGHGWRPHPPSDLRSFVNPTHGGRGVAGVPKLQLAFRSLTVSDTEVSIREEEEGRFRLFVTTARACLLPLPALFRTNKNDILVRFF